MSNFNFLSSFVRALSFSRSVTKGCFYIDLTFKYSTWINNKYSAIISSIRISCFIIRFFQILYPAHSKGRQREPGTLVLDTLLQLRYFRPPLSPELWKRVEWRQSEEINILINRIKTTTASKGSPANKNRQHPQQLLFSK